MNVAHSADLPSLQHWYCLREGFGTIKFCINATTEIGRDGLNTLDYSKDFSFGNKIKW